MVLSPLTVGSLASPLTAPYSQSVPALLQQVGLTCAQVLPHMLTYCGRLASHAYMVCASCTPLGSFPSTCTYVPFLALAPDTSHLTLHTCTPPLSQIRSFVEDSISYLRGLFSPWDLPPALFYHRNRMISKVGGLAGRAPARDC